MILSRYLLFLNSRSCIFDSSTSIFTTAQLTEALMEHMKATMDLKKEVQKGETQSF